MNFYVYMFFREATCNRIAKETGKVIIPPFDHYDVIGGQVGILYTQTSLQ